MTILILLLLLAWAISSFVYGIYNVHDMVVPKWWEHIILIPAYIGAALFIAYDWVMNRVEANIDYY